MKIKVSLICIVVMGLTASARAQFTPGHVFVSQTAGHFCTKLSQYKSDRIIEIDPKTGEWWVFADIPDELCGIMTGLVFTPDGSRLLASSVFQSAIFEFDSDGNISVAYDSTDGIAGPSGQSNLAYDSAGNFYVGNGNETILRFPMDGGPATIFADEDDGVGRVFAIAVASDDNLYLGSFFESVTELRRFVPDGSSLLIEDFGSVSTVLTMTADEANRVYAVVGTGELLVYDSGDLSSREVLAMITRIGSLTLMPDQSKLYYAQLASLHTIDLVSGVKTLVAEYIDPGNPRGRGGVAVVPTVPSDLDRDADVDWNDHAALVGCLAGPGAEADLKQCPRADIDKSGAIDLGDFALLQAAFTGGAA